jgi:anti-sigma regulatory factor (Ser/Thr protein kinase)
MGPAEQTATGRAGDDVLVDLPDDVRAAGLAREVVRETLSRWGVPELIDDAELAVSELVTNAFKHALPPVTLRLTQCPEEVRVAVTDMRPATLSLVLPVSKDSDESGRGRGIIDAVSDHSGTDHGSGGEPGTSSFASWDVDPLR